MPRVSFFYGIAIYMYWNERDHPVPHFHAIQGGGRASVSIDGVVLAGEFDARAIRLVTQWAGLHRDELVSSWKLARDRKPIRPITPLP
jgi:hypothetical protein